jgi:hypothetical protein
LSGFLRHEAIKNWAAKVTLHGRFGFEEMIRLKRYLQIFRFNFCYEIALYCSNIQIFKTFLGVEVQRDHQLWQHSCKTEMNSVIFDAIITTEKKAFRLL